MLLVRQQVPGRVQVQGRVRWRRVDVDHRITRQGNDATVHSIRLH
jgi:hypothetical protein